MRLPASTKRIFTGMKYLRYVCLIAVLHVGQYANAQDKGKWYKYLVQFSGLVVTADSSKPVPFVNVQIKHSPYGTLSNFNGFFTLPVQKRDTLVFSSIGYKRKYFVMPDSIYKTHFTAVITLNVDTITLRTAVIYPYPTLEQFKEVFLSTKVPDDGFARAKKNLEIAEKKAKLDPIPIDGSITYKFLTQQRNDRVYWAGQYQPIRLLDPFAWAQFIKSLKNGDLKIQH